MIMIFSVQGIVSNSAARMENQHFLVLELTFSRGGNFNLEILAEIVIKTYYINVEVRLGIRA